MPRPITTGTAAQRARQRRYRARLTAAGRPEASAVDVAIAAAVTEAIIGAGRKQQTSLDLKTILSKVMRRLERSGYDDSQSRAVLHRRIARHALLGGLEVSNA